MNKYYVLVDTNNLHYYCGHYPEWVVEEREGTMPNKIPTTRRGTPLAYASKDVAEAMADQLNRVSAERWRNFLNS